MLRTSSSLILCLAIGGHPVLAGELTGYVKLLGTNVNQSHSPAVVYVAGTTPAAGRNEIAVVDQRNLQFVPRVQALALGGAIVFRNSDREAHNVNSRSDCCSFNYMIAPSSHTGPGESEPIRPERAGLIRLLCNIHQQMRGYVMVCPNQLFAITDAEGRFQIGDVPDGVHKVSVWHEFSKPLSREIEVSGKTSVNFMLERSAESPRARREPIVVRPQEVVPWTEVLERIRAKLNAAVEAAGRPNGAKEADRLAVDAYFEQFEASELEAAVRLYRGEERVFVIERMFARIRKPLLADLAAHRTDAQSVQEAIAMLAGSIDEDIDVLHQYRVRDRTALFGAAIIPQMSAPAVSAQDVRQAMMDLREAFSEVERLAAAGNSADAAGALADAYFQVFHRIERALAARDFVRMRKIEAGFLELRARIQSDLPADSIRSDLDSLWSDINAAVTTLEKTADGGFAAAVSGCWNSFVILTREGVEALLIVTALLMYLNRLGRPEDRRVIYCGLVVALLATVLTWSALQWAIAQSGMAQETIEGVTALLAGAVLFYVSYWLISRSEARRWQEFLTRQVGKGISAGGKWAIGLAAFLAVYREGAETILMFQPMLVNPARSELWGVAFGVFAAVIALVAVYWGLRFASVRLAIRPFFRVTGALLFVLAVIFAGKGVTELQEAHLLSVSLLPPSLHAAVTAVPPGIRDALGISPTVQSLSIQSTILAGAALSLASLRLTGRLVSPSEPVRSAQRSESNPPTVTQSAV